MNKMKAQRKEACEQLLAQYYAEWETFIMNIIIGNES